MYYTTTTTKCNLCNSFIKCKGSSTFGLTTHMRTIHIIIIKNMKLDETSIAEVPEKQMKVDGFFKRKTLAELLGKCAAKDGMSLKTITKSNAMCESIQKCGFLMPKSQTAVAKLTISSY